MPGSANVPDNVNMPDNVTRLPPSKTQKNAEEERLLRERIIGMVMGMLFAHVFIGIAIYYSYIDDTNTMHTCWIALVGAFICSLVFLYHMGISTSARNGSPFLSTTLWVLVLLDIAVMAYLQNQPYFAPHAIWAWPSIPVMVAIGYIIGPTLDRIFGKLLRLS